MFYYSQSLAMGLRTVSAYYGKDQRELRLILYAQVVIKCDWALRWKGRLLSDPNLQKSDLWRWAATAHDKNDATISTLILHSTEDLQPPRSRIRQRTSVEGYLRKLTACWRQANQEQVCGIDQQRSCQRHSLPSAICQCPLILVYPPGVIRFFSWKVPIPRW